jgi:signal transduction histidine kinase
MLMAAKLDMPDADTPAGPAGLATILIVDDDRGLVRLIEQALKRAGFATAGALSGAAAIAWLARHRADLLLLDLKLQDIGGRELVQRLADRKQSVPFIIITGQGDERAAVEMMKRGALDYLVKDVDFLQFVPEVVRRVLGQIERDKKLAAAEEALRQSEANLARAQQIAHLGSYELNVPFSAGDYRSDEIYRIAGRDPSSQTLSTDQYLNGVVHPDNRQRYREILERAIAEGAPFDFEYRIVRPDGSIRHVQSVGEPIQDAAGQVVKIVGTLLDITERKQLEKAVLEISEREQWRIGQDLHDGLGQSLAGIELMSQVLEQKLAAKKLKAEAARADEIARHVRGAISQTRLLARGLSPVVLESEGLMSALSELAESTEKLFRISCRFHCAAPVLIETHTVATHLYRIVQEAVSNAVKHGRARKIEIHLKSVQDRIMLEVDDNGVGLPKVLPKKRGLGLRIMQYRAGMIGGTATVERKAGGGTRVICSLHRHGHEPAARR